MRNLAQYPITKAEVLECLKQLKDEELAKGAVGDMRPALLQTAIDTIENLPPSELFPAEKAK